MCKILIPIHPIYVDGIMDGTKLYELRRRIPKRKVDKLIIYSTSPIMKVVGEVEVEEIITDTVDNLWKIVGDKSLVSHKEYSDYFHSKDNAHAFKIGKVVQYDEPLPLSELGFNYTPQSYAYID